MSDRKEINYKELFTSFQEFLNVYYDTQSYDDFIEKIQSQTFDLVEMIRSNSSPVNIELFIYDQFTDFYTKLQSKMTKDISLEYKPVAILFYWITKYIVVYYVQNYLVYEEDKSAWDCELGKVPNLEEGIYSLTNLLYDFISDYYESLSGDIKKLERYKERAIKMSGGELKPEKKEMYLNILFEQKSLMKIHGSRSQRASLNTAVKAWGLKQKPKIKSEKRIKQLANNISKLQNKGSLPKN